MPEQWLSIIELSNELQIPIKSLRKWRLEGDGPQGVKIGRHVRYRRRDVGAWLDQLQREQTRAA